MANMAGYLLPGIGIGQEQFLTHLHRSRTRQERTKCAYFYSLTFVIRRFSREGNEDGYFKAEPWDSPAGRLGAVCVYTRGHAPCAVIHSVNLPSPLKTNSTRRHFQVGEQSYL